MSDEKFEPRGCPTPGACSAAARIKELEDDLKGREAICDSYADENQRFFDRIESLEAAGKRLANAMEASGWIEFTGDEFGFRTAIAAWREAEKGGHHASEK